jgi:hypothetical protein
VARKTDVDRTAGVGIDSELAEQLEMRSPIGREESSAERLFSGALNWEAHPNENKTTEQDPAGKDRPLPRG